MGFCTGRRCGRSRGFEISTSAPTQRNDKRIRTGSEIKEMQIHIVDVGGQVASARIRTCWRDVDKSGRFSALSDSCDREACCKP